jgi:hypothetical protein
LVEQRTENPRVGGSIPPQATNLHRPTSRHGQLLHTTTLADRSCVLTGLAPGGGDNINFGRPNAIRGDPRTLRLALGYRF